MSGVISEMVVDLYRRVMDQAKERPLPEGWHYERSSASHWGASGDLVVTMTLTPVKDWCLT